MSIPVANDHKKSLAVPTFIPGELLQGYMNICAHDLKSIGDLIAFCVTRSRSKPLISFAHLDQEHFIPAQRYADV